MAEEQKGLSPDDKPKEKLKKYQPTLLCSSFEPAVARVREFGVCKYGGRNGWKITGLDEYHDAALRHLNATRDDILGIDEESGLPHLWHAACDLMFIIDKLKLSVPIETIEGWYEKYNKQRVD